MIYKLSGRSENSCPKKMNSLIFSTVLVFAISLAGGDLVDRYYMELDCTSSLVKEGSPKSYNCSALENIKKDQCYHKGKHYPVGSNLSSKEVGDGCTPGCRCVEDFTGGASWDCLHNDCPAFIHRPTCDAAYLYTEDNTCCPQFDCEKEKKIKEKLVGTCEYKGKTYMHGEKIEGLDSNCTECLCVEGFDAKNMKGPGCKPTICNLYLHYSINLKKGCVPTFFTTHECCPIPVWRCPDEKDVTVVKTKSSDSDQGTNKDMKCKFGQYQLDLGQSISQGEGEAECVRCSCTTPPHLTCVMDQDCYKKSHPNSRSN